MYRIQKGEDLFAPVAMRGHWENDTTMFIQLINIGEVLNDIDIRVVFSADELSLLVTGVVNGQQITLHGKRITK